jgi:cytidylate kinase
VCREFKSLSEENAGIFQQAAAEKGIPFQHVIMYCETDEALDAVCKEYGDVTLVISESEEQQFEGRIEEGEGVRRELFVYSIV